MRLSSASLPVLVLIRSLIDHLVNNVHDEENEAGDVQRDTLLQLVAVIIASQVRSSRQGDVKAGQGMVTHPLSFLARPGRSGC